MGAAEGIFQRDQRGLRGDIVSAEQTVGNELFHKVWFSMFEDFIVRAVICEMTVGTAYTTIAGMKKRAVANRVWNREPDENILTFGAHK
jgi:hypothetical protein